MNCIACGNSIEENFCSNCGEKSEVNRITFGSMLADTFGTVTNMDKGFLYNLKTLTINPQKITIGYINGLRKGILNPVSYLIYAITIYLIVIIVFDDPKEVSNFNDKPRNWLRQLSYQAGYFIRTHLKYFWIFTIFPLALSSKIIFRKYNYLEHLAISALIIGHATFLSIFSYLIFDTNLIFDPFVYSMIVWLIYKIYRDDRSIGDGLFWTLLTLMFFLILLALVITVIAVLIA